MSPRDWRLRVRDMLDAVSAILRSTEGRGAEDLIEDTQLRAALLWHFTVIGEAAGEVPRDVTERFPLVPWSELRRMRDFVVHYYWGIDHERLWRTIQNDLPPLMGSLDRVLRDEPT